MRVTPLSSGSEGNSVLLESRGVRILIDLGLPLDVIEQRLRAVGVAPRRIDAVFVTHRHRDHVFGVTDFCRKHKARIFTTRCTARRVGSESQRHVHRIKVLEPFPIGHLELLAIPVWHDAPETTALLVEDGAMRYGHATDLGCLAGPIGDFLQSCAGLYLEFNYEPELLRTGPYPEHVKRRIGSDRGHLANDQAQELLRRLAHPRLRQVWLAHLSQRNNRPELALAAARRALGTDSRASVCIARQDAPSATVDLAAAVGLEAPAGDGVAAR